jgi:hypothetical protein
MARVTEYGVIADERAVQTRTTKFLLSAHETLARIGYPNHRKTVDPETRETRWVWTSKDGQSKVEFLGIDQRVPFIYDAYHDCERLPFFAQPDSDPKKDRAGMSATLVLQGWMSEVGYLKYQMDLWACTQYLREEL